MKIKIYFKDGDVKIFKNVIVLDYIERKGIKKIILTKYDFSIITSIKTDEIKGIKIIFK